jgi:hypothetical protein
VFWGGSEDSEDVSSRESYCIPLYGKILLSVRKPFGELTGKIYLQCRLAYK